jgi:hypothetical protein
MPFERMTPEERKRARGQRGKIPTAELPRVIALAVEGKGAHGVMEAYGVRFEAATEAINRALRRVPNPDADLLRAKQLERLERLVELYWPIVFSPMLPAADRRVAHELLLSVFDRIHRIGNIEGPRKVTVNVGDQAGANVVNAQVNAPSLHVQIPSDPEERAKVIEAGRILARGNPRRTGTSG